MTDARRLKSKEDEYERNAQNDAESPEWTEEDFAKARPAREVPGLVEKFRAAQQTLRESKKRGPQKAPTKQQVTIRLDRAAVDWFKADGPGWQTRINDALVDYVAEKSQKA